MDEDQDPASLFFPDQESVDLYEVLTLKSSATLEEIRKSYRRLALIYHPDKHAATPDEKAKANASTKFQQVGFAYAVLSDEKRRARYDQTGRTDEGFALANGEDGWEVYFEQLFERVTRGKLDEMKKEYQGSDEEKQDLGKAYVETDGSIGDVMTYIPHSTHEDEARFIIIISELVSKGSLPRLPKWESGTKDEKGRLVRKKQGEKEAKEAEKLAKELGVWDEFYGNGKTTNKPSKEKRKRNDGDDTAKDDVDGEDHSALQALILKKKKNMDNFFDDLAAKYSEPSSKSKGKGRKKANGEKAAASPPDIDDEEFNKLRDKVTRKSSRVKTGRVKT